MSYFKITLIRSAIGLPRKTQGVLSALGLRKRMRTVFHPVSPQIAGHIMKVKELVAVSEVESALTKAEMRDIRRPEPGYYIEKKTSPALEEGLWYYYPSVVCSWEARLLLVDREASGNLVEESVTSFSRPPNQRRRSRAVRNERFSNIKIRREVCGFMEGILETRNWCMEFFCQSSYLSSQRRYNETIARWGRACDIFKNNTL